MCRCLCEVTLSEEYFHSSTLSMLFLLVNLGLAPAGKTAKDRIKDTSVSTTTTLTIQNHIALIVTTAQSLLRNNHMLYLLSDSLNSSCMIFPCVCFLSKFYSTSHLVSSGLVTMWWEWSPDRQTPRKSALDKGLFTSHAPRGRNVGPGCAICEPASCDAFKIK